MLGERAHFRGVVYEDGVKVDWSIWPESLLERVAGADPLPDDLDVGYRVLLDEAGRTAGWPPPTFRAHIPTPPSADEYDAIVREFWWSSTYVAKGLRRGELTLAKYALDVDLKLDALRRMLEWRLELDHDWSLRPGVLGTRARAAPPAGPVGGVRRDLRRRRPRRELGRPLPHLRAVPPGRARRRGRARLRVPRGRRRTDDGAPPRGARSLDGGLQRRGDAGAIAGAAARLVRVERADLDRRPVERCGLAVDEPLRARRGAAAAMADGLQLVDELGHAEEQRHRPERLAAEVAVQARGDDPLAPEHHLLNRVDDLGLEELRLVDPDDVVPLGAAQRVADAVDRDRTHARAGVADDVRDVVAVVDPRLHDQHALARDLGAAQAPDELLALAAEHRAAHDLEPTAAAGNGPDHGAGPYKEVTDGTAYASRVRLFIVRHAKAAGGEPDEVRPLTGEGREQARDLGKRFAADGIRPDAVLTSPLLRARETAEEIGNAVGVEPEADERLAPGATPTPFARRRPGAGTS